MESANVVEMVVRDEPLDPLEKDKDLVVTARLTPVKKLRAELVQPTPFDRVKLGQLPVG